MSTRRIDGPLELQADVVELAARLRQSLVPFARMLRRSDGHHTPTQQSVLGAIGRLEPITLSDLAAHERLSLPMISRVVATLEQEGLVRRVADPTDRRVCRVRLSRAGHDWIEKGRARRNAVLADRLAVLDADEHETLRAAVALIDRLTADAP